MFIASKLLALLTQPLWWVIALLVFACFVGRRRPFLAQGLVGTALTLLLLLGWQPLPELLIRQLESRHAEFAPQAPLQDYAGAIVLGGGTASGHVAQAHIQPLVTDSAERLTTPVVMLRYNPHLRLVYTGGEGEWSGVGPSEAERARQFFDSMGLSSAQVIYESASRNTYENAVLTAQLPQIDKTQRWLLVTSAFHMPRSMATFAKAGWNVTAYPVDFRTGTDTPWLRYSLREGLTDWQLALHEYLGLLAYRITGRL